MHFLGGAIFTYNIFPNADSISNIKKFAITLTSSLFYGSKQYLYNFKKSFLSTLDDQKIPSYLEEGIKFASYVTTDIALSVITFAPFIMIMGFPSTMSYLVMQGAATGMINYYNDFNGKQYEERSADDVIAFISTSASTLFFSMKILNLPTPAEKIIATACAVQALATVHFLSKSVYNVGADLASQAINFDSLLSPNPIELHNGEL